MKHRLVWGLLVLALVVNACTNSSSPSGQSETALFNDVALDVAQSIDSSRLSVATSSVVQNLDIPNAAELAALASQANTLPKSAISYPNASLDTPVDTVGYVVYVQNQNKKYSLRKATVNENGASGNQLLYKGKYAIESAAISVDGSYVSFVAETFTGNSEVFFLDFEGKLTGKRRGLYRITDTEGDESDISMSLDGLTLAWEGESETTEQRNYTVAVIDEATAGISFQSFDIVLGGAFQLDIYEPSLSGDGRTVVFAETEVATQVFGAPMIVSFSTVGEGGALEYVGEAGLTTAIEDPSTSFAADRLLFKETFDGVDYVIYINSELAELYALLGGAAIEHPYLTADGAFYTFEFGGEVYLSEVKTDDPLSASIDILKSSAGTNSAPYWVKQLPPPPPLPEGTIQYEGSTIGGPLWTRPEGTGPELQDNGPVAYDAYSFTTGPEGFYDFLSLQDYDGYLHLYLAPFNPDAPLTNVVAGNDDLPGGGRRSGFKVFLEANTGYVLVTSAFEQGQAGNFTNTITPPQPAEPGEAPTIEIFNGNLSVAATGETISFEWFITSFEALNCTIDYGDGTSEAVDCATDTLQRATHSYAAEGFYTATLTATNSNGSTVAKAFPTIANNDPNAFDIVVVFANDLLSEGQRAAFQDAAARWGEVITSDLSSYESGGVVVPSDYSCFGEAGFNGFVDDLVISASGQVIDGAGNILASAGPCLFRPDGTNGTLAPLSVYGIMQFDVADLENLEQNGGLFSTILHEMGHVLGIGTLWDDNGFLIDGEAEGADPTDPSYDPKYTGVDAVNAYNNLLDGGSESTVPAANTGGPGTREGHWREATFDNELMTGFLNNADEPLSILTVGGLEDLGYTVDYTKADPFTLPSGSNLSNLTARGFTDIVLDNIGQNKGVKR